MPTEIKIAKFKTPTELQWADCCKCGTAVTAAAAHALPWASRVNNLARKVGEKDEY